MKVSIWDRDDVASAFLEAGIKATHLNSLYK